MTGRCLLLLFIAMLPGLGDEVPSRLVDVGTGKAVTFPDAISSDGRYAIGWTILLQDKTAKPIDWTQWKSDSPRDIIDLYANPEAETTKDDEYLLVDCVIDLKAKSMITLPSTDPYYPNKSHCDMAFNWSPVEEEKQYAMVNNDARYLTTNLWLVVSDGTGMHQVEMMGALNKAIAPLVQQKRPLTYAGYGTSFFVADADKKSAFKKSSATISFTADIPKSQIENSEVDGQVTILLPEGKIGKVTTETTADDPLVESPALGKADAELNKLYAQLQQKLSSADKVALKKEQLDWIHQRDLNASSAQDAIAGSDAATVQAARNKSMLADTTARLEVLRARLK